MTTTINAELRALAEAAKGCTCNGAFHPEGCPVLRFQDAVDDPARIIDLLDKTEQLTNENDKWRNDFRLEESLNAALRTQLDIAMRALSAVVKAHGAAQTYTATVEAQKALAQLKQQPR